MKGFGGLRDLVTEEAVEAFRQHLPRELRKRPREWRRRDIFSHFSPVWKLLAWSRFGERLRTATLFSYDARKELEEEFVGTVSNAEPAPAKC